MNTSALIPFFIIETQAVSCYSALRDNLSSCRSKGLRIGLFLKQNPVEYCTNCILILQPNGCKETCENFELSFHRI